MATMKINYGTFESWASKIDAKNKRLDETLREIEKKIHSLQGAWESDSSTSIRDAITGMEPKFESYYEVVNNYVKFLRNTANEWKSTESTNDQNAKQFM